MLIEILVLLLHFVLGVFAARIKLLGTLWIYVFILYAVTEIIRTKNKGGFAHLAAAYICGLDVLIRMDQLSFFYEGAKYTVILFFFLAMVFENKKTEAPLSILVFWLLLLPSIFIGDYPTLSKMRSAVSFNLSGPLCIVVSFFYFYKRPLPKIELSKILKYLCLALFGLLGSLIVKLPAVEQMKFNLSSNHMTSGDFGPNQVALVFSVGFFVIILSTIIMLPVFKNRIIDYVLAFVFITFSVFTFSRGGIFSAAAALLAAMIATFLQGFNLNHLRRLVGILLITLIAGYFITDYLNKITGDKLGDRYVETFESGKGVEGIEVSGRDGILIGEFQMFFENPIMGVGPGIGQLIRIDQSAIGHGVVSHTEYTRLLAEHGLYGIPFLLFLVFYPLKHFLEVKSLNKVVAAGFLIFALFTLGHAATRLSIDAFFFGLGFIIINFNDETNPLETRLVETSLV